MYCIYLIRNSAGHRKRWSSALSWSIRTLKASGRALANFSTPVSGW
ncbi:MAG: hypothetical protein J6Q81_04405 [Lentisphaeria bacterium]|nr:hypothetical protein [Lentisphaeria bacterium]